MPADIRQRILKVDRLPSPPVLAAELLALTAKEDVKIADIAALIERDPALTAKLLKLCNSAAFGLRHEVGSVERATVMLGIRQIKCLALGFMLLDKSEMTDAKGFDFPMYWTRASVAAVAARALAEKHNPALSGEAFVAGLVQDIGVLLLHHLDPNLYKSVLHAHERSGGRLQDIEDAILGVAHPEAGQILLNHWALPETIHIPVGAHHAPQTYDPQNHHPQNYDPKTHQHDDRVKQIVHIVAASGEIANLFCDVQKAESLDRVTRACSAFFSIADAELRDLLTKVGQDAIQAAWMFEITPTHDLDFNHIQQQADQELAQLATSD